MNITDFDIYNNIIIKNFPIVLFDNKFSYFLLLISPLKSYYNT